MIAAGKSRIDQLGHWYIKANAVECANADDDAYFDGAQTSLAIKILNKLADKNEPFFLSVGYYRPHLPFNAPRKYWDLYDRDSIPLAKNQYPPQGSPGYAVHGDQELRSYDDCHDLPLAGEKPWEEDSRFYQKYIDAGLNEFDAIYASMLEGMDRSLGDIMTNLKRHGIENNTIIIFMSDNGQPSKASRNVPLRGHKLTPYEGGIRVPMIVKWPGITVPGSDCQDYIIIEDIFPAILELAGVKESVQIDKKTDGVSFVPLLEQSGNYPKDRAIFWHYPHTYDQPPYSTVRKGDWKLIYHHIERKPELFNLKDDISENNDLASENPEKLRELAVILTDFLKESGALMPMDKTTGKPVEYPDKYKTQ